MKATELRRAIRDVPDDAEVSYKLIFDRCPTCDGIKDLEHIDLVFTLGSDLWQVNKILEYKGLPK